MAARVPHANALSVEVRSRWRLEDLADPRYVLLSRRTSSVALVLPVHARATTPLRSTGRSQLMDGGAFMWLRQAQHSGDPGTRWGPARWPAEHDGYTVARSRRSGTGAPFGSTKTKRVD